ncbi:NADPH-dependent FMN reductase [Aquirufa salirivi]|uniref:NAD(P)H-dependent oxidoreductase n=1 Tax=Aquirufa salirivi TaxID=3104729 RepID=A0ABW8RXG2_9BACT
MSKPNPRILVITGSPRKESNSARIALHLYDRIKQDGEYAVDLLDVREYQLPPFESVFESVDTCPEAYKPLAQKFFSADAYIVVTPEYNGSYTSTLQNLFDHFPRQQRKVYGVVTATNGSLGGMRASQQLMLFIIALFGIVSPYMLVTPFVDKKFDSNGVLLDESFQPKIDFFLDQFNWLFCKIGMSTTP